jgi:signal transduction histidine kinase
VVHDDGRGLDAVAKDVTGSHFGLQGIRERVDKLGGSLQMDSRPAGGTRISVTVPAQRRRPTDLAARLWDESWRTS